MLISTYMTICIVLLLMWCYHNLMNFILSRNMACFLPTAAATMSCSGNQSVGGTTSSSTESPVRSMVRSRSVLGRLPSYAQPTVASLIRASRSNDLLSGNVTQLQMCPRCRPSEFTVDVELLFVLK